MLKVAYLLSCLTVVNAGSHSLMALATYIVGQTPFPEFSVVLMLDDLQILYYDSTTYKPVYRTKSDSKYYDEEQSDVGVVFQDMYYSIKNRDFYANEHLNHTDGVHVYQRLAGCELLNNDKPGPIHSWDAFDGQCMEEFTYDLEKNDIRMKKPWIISWDQVKKLHIQFIYENVYHPICIKTLKRYLHLEKNNVMRKVKPRVRLMRKKLPDSQGLQISCLATGFYPRHINLTLFRDGHPVDDDQITGGEILPNGDRTYQMRKSLVISDEELREGHNYNCTMKHLNLDNKLDIIFDTDKYDPGGSFRLSVVMSVLVLMCVAVIITALIKWRKKTRAGPEPWGKDDCPSSLKKRDRNAHSLRTPPPQGPSACALHSDKAHKGCECPKCGPEKSSFEGLSGPSPYPYPSNQKRIETALPLHMHAQNRGEGREDSPVLFTSKDQCPSSGASGLVSFGGSEEDDSNDPMSLAASDIEKWSKTPLRIVMLSAGLRRNFLVWPASSETGVDENLDFLHGSGGGSPGLSSIQQDRVYNDVEDPGLGVDADLRGSPDVLQLEES
ncbi:major histocompatibility complex class I-related gene protein-like [Rhinichthys klamathensis goyatoka]|uniref:major histocompatibility complex class I-related gene protein-like n=1 Tax=Rhinichthys klamathensis goyatoka TaxID=3034132 RepID=UPI0024B62019|nr:major histocompatibility complex class I-related gene protein-like [Rhinichthys klamathensis goyatoka]